MPLLCSVCCPTPSACKKNPPAPRYERKRPLPMLETVSPPSRRRFSRGFAASAILSLRCKQPETPLPSLVELHPTLTPASLRRLLLQYSRPIPLMNTTLTLTHATRRLGDSNHLSVSQAGSNKWQAPSHFFKKLSKKKYNVYT